MTTMPLNNISQQATADTAGNMPMEVLQGNGYRFVWRFGSGIPAGTPKMEVYNQNGQVVYDASNRLTATGSELVLQVSNTQNLLPAASYSYRLFITNGTGDAATNLHIAKGPFVVSPV